MEVASRIMAGITVGYSHRTCLDLMRCHNFDSYNHLFVFKSSKDRVQSIVQICFAKNHERTYAAYFPQIYETVSLLSNYFFRWLDNVYF